MAALIAQTTSMRVTGTRMLKLQRLGYRVFRVHNVDVYENIGGVLDTLLAFIEDSR
jgi:very-short-patch-repair endonuclease